MKRDCMVSTLSRRTSSALTDVTSGRTVTRGTRCFVQRTEWSRCERARSPLRGVPARQAARDANHTSSVARDDQQICGSTTLVRISAASSLRLTAPLATRRWRRL